MDETLAERPAGAGKDPEHVPAGHMRPWEVDELPAPPQFRFDPRRVVGPGLLMAGAAIGGGEWLMGPAVTARYGGTVMWIATLSILLQSAYNLEVMRYALYCGEPVFVGFFRTLPGPRFWTAVYLLLDFGSLWPYLSANAAVPLMAAFLGHLPAEPPTNYLSVAEVAATTGLPTEVIQEIADEPERFGKGPGKKPYPDAIAKWIEREHTMSHWVAYAVFLACFTPLIFGGKIYNALEKIMTAKIILVLGYLLFLGIFYVDWSTWVEIFTGFVKFGSLPEVDGEAVTWSAIFTATWRGEQPPVDVALLAAFAAIAGQGGLTNCAFSNYAREKGWGMGSLVGAIPSAVGGKGIKLSHNGRVFRLSEESKKRWRGWRSVTIRDQLGIWIVGCILGVGIPAMVSRQFVAGRPVQGNALAAMTAQGLVEETGVPVFWFLTLLCGFLVLAPSQLSTIDGLVRRWTDVLWTGSRRLGQLKEEKVAYVYYTLLVVYAMWGLFVLTYVPDPLVIVRVGTGVLYNFALGFSAIHALAVNWTLLPKELRPGWFMRLSLVACAVFFLGISATGVPQALKDLGIL